MIFEITSCDKYICCELDYRRNDRNEVIISKNFWCFKAGKTIYSSLREINDRLLKILSKILFHERFISLYNSKCNDWTIGTIKLVHRWKKENWPETFRLKFAAANRGGKFKKRLISIPSILVFPNFIFELITQFSKLDNKEKSKVKSLQLKG